MCIQRKVKGIEGDVAPKQCLHFSESRTGEGTQPIPEKTVVNEEKLGIPGYCRTDGRLTGIHSHDEVIHCSRSIHLESIQSVGVIRKLGYLEGALKKIEDLF